MKAALEIVQKYTEPGIPYDLKTVEEDLLQLSALRASMSEMVGYISGLTTRHEESKKFLVYFNIDNIRPLVGDA